MTGPNLLQPGPGAILDVSSGEGDPPAGAFIACWQRHAGEILGAIGWSSEQASARVFLSGLSLALSAPVDALYAATEVNEWAFEQARRECAGELLEPVDVAARRLRALVEEESRPRLRELSRAASERGLPWLSDDELLTLGLGCGSRSWPVDELPLPSEVDWSGLAGLPVALVTGTNGKSTTVRMLAAMVGAAGLVPGLSSTDRIEVGGRVLDAGDWSGPGGARRVLRQREVQVAILETARGGLLRRGLAVERADVAVITNVAADHLGEWGVSDIDELADAKLVVARIAERLVLNADDELLVSRAGELGLPVTWFGMDADGLRSASRVAAGGDAAWLAGGDLMLRAGGRELRVTTLAEVPATLTGAARFNVANALAAIAAASALALPVAAMAEGLRRFRNDSADNPGRLNLFELGGLRVMVDFAHNPHGLRALLETAAALRPERLLVVLGQAGDRDDESIAALGRVAAAARPDRVIVKEMERHARGRPAGEVAALLEAALVEAGQAAATIERAPSELEAARLALAWSRPGDLLLLLCHAQRDEVLELLRRLSPRP